MGIQNDFQQRLPEGEESDWVEFARLPIASGKLRISDPMFFRDLPPSPTFAVARGLYHVRAKLVTYADDRRVSRLQILRGEIATLGHRLGEVGVDFAQVAVFDPVVLDAAAEAMDDAQAEQFVAELDAIEEYGIAHLGLDERAIMPLAASGFGDGGYPIHELVHKGERVGMEVVFIGPEVLAD
jgi:hypothetical protein